MTLDDDEARELARRMACAHIMRIDEMPRIELYLDQVLALVSQSLSFMVSPRWRSAAVPLTHERQYSL